MTSRYSSTKKFQSGNCCFVFSTWCNSSFTLYQLYVYSASNVNSLENSGIGKFACVTEKNVTKYAEIHYSSVTTLVLEHALSIPAPLAISENLDLFLYLLLDPNQFEISTNFVAKVLVVATLDQ
ncbi:hypothetical protein TNCV_36611 [Trichonephila clavipes]|nr:hypothetical protein TNCV_36611 [Trichonephila clavipes]